MSTRGLRHRNRTSKAIIGLEFDQHAPDDHLPAESVGPQQMSEGGGGGHIVVYTCINIYIYIYIYSMI